MNTKPTHTDEELWSILMKLADPSDLIHSILGDARETVDRVNFVPVGQSTLLFQGCSVTVHKVIVHHGQLAAPSETPSPAV